MGQFAAFYVELSKDSVEEAKELSQSIEAKGFYFCARYLLGKPWLQLSLDSPENLPHHGPAISKIFSQRRVVGLGAYTGTDSTVFCEYLAGEAIRLLKSGFQRELCWEQIEGSARDWEAVILEDVEIEVGRAGMTCHHLQQIAQEMGLPGFGSPGIGEAWSFEKLH